jgi:hypothetical protein
MNLCKICKRRLGNLNGRFAYCVECVEAVQDAHICEDCGGPATVIVEEGVPHLVITVGHWDTCPIWRAIQREAS